MHHPGSRTGRIRAFCALLLLMMVAVSAMSPGAAKAAGARVVTAAATCVRSIDAEHPYPAVQVTIENRSGLTLHVAYAQSFGSRPIREEGPTGLRLAKPKLGKVVKIPDGEMVTLEARWAGGDLMRSHVIVALVVTSAGVFLPACDQEPRVMTYRDELPADEEAEIVESAMIAAEAIGQLEAWRAYPALYALLHPDVRKQIPYEAVVCWYAERFGPPITDETQHIFSTEATAVKVEAWTWGVTGKAYERSVEVTYERAVARSATAESEKGTMRLVRAGGLWRWFLGDSADAVAALPTDCDLPETI